MVFDGLIRPEVKVGRVGCLDNYFLEVAAVERFVTDSAYHIFHIDGLEAGAAFEHLIYRVMASHIYRFEVGTSGKGGSAYPIDSRQIGIGKRLAVLEGIGPYEFNLPAVEHIVHTVLVQADASGEGGVRHNGKIRSIDTLQVRTVCESALEEVNTVGLFVEPEHGGGEGYAVRTAEVFHRGQADFLEFLAAVEGAAQTLHRLGHLHLGEVGQEAAGTANLGDIAGEDHFLDFVGHLVVRSELVGRNGAAIPSDGIAVPRAVWQNLRLPFGRPDMHHAVGGEHEVAIIGSFIIPYLKTFHLLVKIFPILGGEIGECSREIIIAHPEVNIFQFPFIAIAVKYSCESVFVNRQRSRVIGSYIPYLCSFDNIIAY